MKQQYFGTDGIRGTVGQPPLTPDFVLQLANAVGRVLKKDCQQDGKRPAVLIGKDTRISGYMFESALESGFNAAGVDVVLLGPVPTPAVAYLTRAQRAALGVVISASHNPFGDNGIKFFSAQGNKLPDAWELAVEAALQEPLVCVPSEQLGKTTRLHDADGRYIEFCKSTFSSSMSLHGCKIVVDAAHGAAYQIAPAVFHELGAEMVALGCDPDGLNINQGVGATHPQALVAAVKVHDADYGIALDGDADRLLMVDGQGRIFNGDELVYLLAQDRLAQGQTVPGVAGTLMSNMGIEAALARQNIELVRAKVGDRHVLEALQQRGWQIGGESSGHILVLDKHSTGDGIISALQVLQAVVRSGQSMAKMLAGAELYPQTMINVRLPAGTDWQALPGLQAAIAAAEQALGADGRVLIRPSGTEPVLRVMVEARDAKQSQHWAEQIAQQVPSVA
ncbi:MAG: phosphoglucosamine mutase [Brachymonas sp.]|nr:phosphoglucosamine mutase [Brachymonas sp.]